MSGEVALWAARQDIKNHPAKMVLIALGDAFDDRSGRCFPSRQAIADFVRRSESATKAAIRWLEENGWIKREARFTESGRQTSSSYEIIFERGESFLDMVERRRKIHGDKQARWDANRKALEGERGYIPPENDEGAVEDPQSGRESAPSKGTEKSPPLTKSLLNNSAQARDDENSVDEKELCKRRVQLKAIDKASGEPHLWDHRLFLYRKSASWAPKWGPAMHKPGCLIPQHWVDLWDLSKGRAFRQENPEKLASVAKKSWTNAIRGDKAKPNGRNLPGTSHD
jgi:hypothetical protein